jgi:hypothetical protein
MIRIDMRSAAALGTILLLAGCGLLDTSTPDIIQPGNLDTPAGAAARQLGAIRDFGFAKDGDGSQVDTEGLVLLTGDMADEFAHSGFIPSTVEFDQRVVLTNNSSLFDLYFRLHRARVAAEGAAVALQQHSLKPDSAVGIPEMLSLAGFTYIYFGENFCSGVPYSQARGDSLVFGPSVTTTETFKRAVERFDSALAHPALAGDPDVAHLAAVGKGRALLDLDSFPQAAQAVLGVPTEFQYLTEHSPAPLSLSNAIFVYGTSPQGTDGGSISVANVEGTTGLPYRSPSDPRVPFRDTGHLGFDQTTPQFDVLKYPEPGSPVVTAGGVEARLIEAEAQLQSGDLPGMTATLNNLRQTAISPALPTVAQPGTQTAAVDLLFSERAFWLYGTGHRLSDMRRLVRKYGRGVDTVFAVGTYLRGGSYGDLVNFPVPVDEETNPRFQRAACDPRAP